MTTYSRCAGCRNGEGPPDCAIRICARERGYGRCSSCADLEGCTRFDWMGEYGKVVKEKAEGEPVTAAGGVYPEDEASSIGQILPIKIP